MRKILLLLITAVLAAILFYLSRFWFLSLWPRSGLLGFEAVRPQGGLLGQWLRGTVAAPFELLIWAVLCFLVLSWAQKAYDRFAVRSATGDDSD